MVPVRLTGPVNSDIPEYSARLAGVSLDTITRVCVLERGGQITTAFGSEQEKTSLSLVLAYFHYLKIIEPH